MSALMNMQPHVTKKDSFIVSQAIEKTQLSYKQLLGLEKQKTIEDIDEKSLNDIKQKLIKKSILNG